jgi:hypothetical protein
MIYNQSRNLELVSRFLELKKQGKYRYDQNQKEYLKLLNYRYALEEHAF